MFSLGKGREDLCFAFCKYTELHARRAEDLSELAGLVEMVVAGTAFTAGMLRNGLGEDPGGSWMWMVRGGVCRGGNNLLPSTVKHSGTFPPLYHCCRWRSVGAWSKSCEMRTGKAASGFHQEINGTNLTPEQCAPW